MSEELISRRVALLVIEGAGALLLAVLAYWVRRALKSIPEPQPFKLKNGLEVQSYQKGETEFLEREIFEDTTYLPTDVSLSSQDGAQSAVVFDVGANIGMFSLFVGCKSKQLGLPRPRVYSFEPIPHIHAICSENVATRHKGLYETAQVACLGVSDHPHETTFEFHHKFSLHSSGVAGFNLQRHERFQRDLRSMLEAYTSSESAPAFLSWVPTCLLLGLGRMFLFIINQKTPVRCTCTTVSEEMRRHGLERIDLLKVDCEGAEEMVLRGVDDDDWPKIRQIICELESFAEVDRIKKMLEQRGFRVSWKATERDANKGVSSEVSHLWAVRAET